MAIFITLLLVGLSLLSFILWLNNRRSQRADYIRTYMFPPGLIDKLPILE